MAFLSLIQIFINIKNKKKKCYFLIKSKNKKKIENGFSSQQ